MSASCRDISSAPVPKCPVSSGSVFVEVSVISSKKFQERLLLMFLCCCVSGGIRTFDPPCRHPLFHPVQLTWTVFMGRRSLASLRPEKFRASATSVPNQYPPSRDQAARCGFALGGAPRNDVPRLAVGAGLDLARPCRMRLFRFPCHGHQSVTFSRISHLQAAFVRAGSPS
jgi:hypothetical protein